MSSNRFFGKLPENIRVIKFAAPKDDVGTEPTKLALSRAGKDPNKGKLRPPKKAG